MIDFLKGGKCHERTSIYSASNGNIRKILGGAHEDEFPTISEFENNINKRLNVQTRLSGI